MDKESKELLATVAKTQNKGTGLFEIAENIMKVPGHIDQKMQALIDIFESTKPKWPPMAKDGSIVPACKQGCSYCCHLNVDVLKSEINLLWKKVEKKLSLLQKAAIVEQARENYDIKHKLTHSERINTRLVCPFLSPEKECLVYEDRPLSCRGMYSGNIKDCEKGAHGEYQNLFWAAPYLISSDMITGAAVGLMLSSEGLDDPMKVTTQLETGILQQFDKTIEDHGL